VALRFWRNRVQDQTGKPARTLYWSLPAFLGFSALGWLLSGGPFQVEYPGLGTFTCSGGERLSAEYTALTLGLILYTAAFIADIVRAGIQSVPYGQVEAARAQGFSGGKCCA